MARPMRVCEVEGCTDEHHGLGKCARHYQQMNYYEKQQAEKIPRSGPTLERTVEVYDYPASRPVGWARKKALESNPQCKVESRNTYGGIPIIDLPAHWEAERRLSA